MKPYIYAGIALLIVGLFSYGLWTSARLESAHLTIESKDKEISQLQASNKDLIAANARKAGAADAYISMTTYVQTLTSQATGIIKGYRARETENEKCLDLTPPSTLVDKLRENSIRRQDNT